MVGRFIVRECDSQVLVEGATVTVKTVGTDPETVASGTTDFTGTVALILPPRAGRRLQAVVTLPDGPPDENGDPTLSTTKLKFTTKCGVNEINVAFGTIQKLCILVRDSETNTPIPGVGVQITTPRTSGGEFTHAEGVTDSDGVACLDIDFGGQVTIRVNSNPNNPDYGVTSQQIIIPNCQDYEAVVELGLITNNPGCYKLVLWGCWCGWPGVTVTVKGRVVRDNGLLGTCSTLIGGVEYWEQQEEWSDTFTTDATGRAWICSGEGHVAPFFGNQYNPDTNQYECWIITGIRIDPPSPFRWQEWNFLVPGYGQVGGPGPAVGNPDSDAGIYPNNSGWFIQMFTPGRIVRFGDPDGPFNFCGRNCNDQIPEQVTIQWDPEDQAAWDAPGGIGAILGGSTTLVNTAAEWYAPTRYTKCIPMGNNTAITISLDIPYGVFDCGDFDSYMTGFRGSGGVAYLQMRRLWGTCDGTVFLGSEKILDMVSSPGGTTACPINFDMEEWGMSVHPGPPVVVTRDPITVRGTVTG